MYIHPILVNSKRVIFAQKRWMRVNVGRAKEIVESADMVHVTYEGTPVIIQHVDEKTKMARIYSRKDPEHEQDVPVLNLIEE